MRVRGRAPPAAPVPAGRAAPPVAPARVVRLAVVFRVPLVGAPAAVEPGQHGGDEEEDAVHDAEGEAGLEHGAGLVRVDRDAVAVEAAKDAKVHVVLVAAAYARAVGAAYEAEVVDCCYECAYEACCCL